MFFLPVQVGDAAFGRYLRAGDGEDDCPLEGTEVKVLQHDFLQARALHPGIDKELLSAALSRALGVVK